MSITSLSDAKAHARITITDDDDLVQSMIDASEAHVANYLGKTLASFSTTLGSTLTAGNFTIGTVYTIQSIGSTDFTLIGASANCVGQTFTATGVGSGTGTAAPQVAGALPDPIALAIKQLVAFQYDNRNAAEIGNTLNVLDVSPGFYDLLAPYYTYIF